MRNVVIIGISDTATCVILFIDIYNLFNILGSSDLPEQDEITTGGVIQLRQRTNLVSFVCDLKSKHKTELIDIYTKHLVLSM